MGLYKCVRQILRNIHTHIISLKNKMTFKKEYSSKKRIISFTQISNTMSAKKEKICCTCKQKDRTFSKNCTKNDGLDNRCKDCHRTYSQTLHQINWASEIVRNSRKHDKDMHRPIDSYDYIDKSWVQELVRDNPNCHYCNVPLAYGRGVNRQTHPRGLQLDRMDSALEHLKSNCVQCCNTCNKRGNNKPYKQKIEIVIKIFL